MAEITLRGNPIHTAGELPAVGSAAPAFTLTGGTLGDVSLGDFSGKTVVLNIFPSIDTGVCAASVRAFNEKAAEPRRRRRAQRLGRPAVRPGPLLRCRGHRERRRRRRRSAAPSASDYGVAITDGPMAGLMSRGRRRGRPVGHRHLHRAGPGDRPGTELRRRLRGDLTAGFGRHRAGHARAGERRPSPRPRRRTRHLARRVHRPRRRRPAWRPRPSSARPPRSRSSRRPACGAGAAPASRPAPSGGRWRRTPPRPGRPPSSSTRAEGEPGSFKDRTLLARNPYRVLEGALIAADTVGAERVVIAVKASFIDAAERLHRAIAEVGRGGWGRGIDISRRRRPRGVPVRRGDGAARGRRRPPAVPTRRAAVPRRRSTCSGATRRSPTTSRRWPTWRASSPTGPAWFREHGTEQSPGTIVCTVSGRDAAGRRRRGRHGHAAAARSSSGSVAARGRAATSRPCCRGSPTRSSTPARLDTPLTYEDMEAAGSGLGACGFIVFDDADDMVAVAAGVARFLAVESCGQCTPCKQDGLAIAAILAPLLRRRTAPTRTSTTSPPGWRP